jgi:hypothetical protein
MTGIDILHVAIMPPITVSSGLIEQVSAAVSQPNYQIRMLLAGSIPKLIGHFRDKLLADEAIRALNNLKLTAFVVSESELRSPVSPEFIANSVKIEGSTAIFANREGKSKTVDDDNGFLILVGRRTRTVGDEAVETTTMKVNLPATLLTGGIPVMKRVSSKTREPNKITEQFIRIYERASDIPKVEVRQFDFDYSFLGEKMGPAATGNIAQAAMVLRQIFSRAYFDDRLASGFVSESKSISGIDLMEQNCLLLVRYYRSFPINK